MKWSRGGHSAAKEGDTARSTQEEDTGPSSLRGGPCAYLPSQIKRGTLQPTGQLKRGTSPKQPLTQLRAKERTSVETVAATVGHHSHLTSLIPV